MPNKNNNKKKKGGNKPSRRKIFLHLGAHKTATTFIQENLDASREAFLQQNCRVILLGRDMKIRDNAFRKLRKGETLSPKTEQSLSRFFFGILKATRHIFFSSERPIGVLDLKSSSGALYPDMAANVQRFKDNLGRLDITVGFAVRNPADFIESSYLQLAGRGNAQPFDDYVKSIDIDNLSWRGPVQDLVDVFGEDHIRLWKYEDFKKEPLKALARIIEAAGYKVELLPTPIVEPSNVSIPRQTLPLMLEWNRLFVEAGMKPKNYRTLYRKLRDVLTKAPPSTREVRLLSDEVRARLTQRYEADMKAIFEKWPRIELNVLQDAVADAGGATSEPAPA